MFTARYSPDHHTRIKHVGYCSQCAQDWPAGFNYRRLSVAAAEVQTAKLELVSVVSPALC